MNFRHLLEKHKLSSWLSKVMNRWFYDAGIYLKAGVIMGATIINTVSLTKNKAKVRDPECIKLRMENSNSLA